MKPLQYAFDQNVIIAGQETIRCAQVAKDIKSKQRSAGCPWGEDIFTPKPTPPGTPGASARSPAAPVPVVVAEGNSDSPEPDPLPRKGYNHLADISRS